MTKFFLKTLLYLIRITLVIIFLVLVIILVSKDLVITGSINAVYNLSDLSPFISTLRPASRVNEPFSDSGGNYWQQVTAEPIYFDVRLPRLFKNVKVIIKYKNIDQSVFELGLLADNKNWIFDLKPIDNKILNKMYADKLFWSKLQEGSFVLFQKEDTYPSLDDFLQKPPLPESIATYNFNLNSSYTKTGYQPSIKLQVINKSLRGSHTLITYIKNEELNYNFLIQDVNRHIGEDYLNLAVFNETGEQITNKFIKDDGNITDDGRMSEAKEINLVIPNLPEGYYRLELQASNDDIFIRQIRTRQSLLVFKNTVYLADDSGYTDEFIEERKKPTKLYTNGYRFSALTAHKEGLQSIGIADKVLKVLQTHKTYNIITGFDNKFITISKNDIKLTANGLVSFSSSSFFEPLPTSLRTSFDYNEKKIKYFVADYTPPTTNGEIQEQTVVFTDLNRFFTEDNKLHFVLSLPNIKAGDEGILIDEIKVVLTRPPLSWQDITNKIKQKVLALL